MSRPPKNYRWWQEHGQEWSGEVARRKAHMPIYHLQEIFLEEYVSACAPLKVLEFGCGFGRHLEYLRKVPKVEVFGFDQSESMVGQMRFAGPAWRRKHVVVGKPLATLPYDDDSFDLVFTVSVLIHVRPRDLDAVLVELCRVSRNQILHIENNATDETVETSKAHDGCWAHDLEAAYARVAPELHFETLPRCFELEDIYRVARDPKSLPAAMRASRAERFLALDQAISTEILRMRGEVTRFERRDSVLEAQTTDLRARLQATIDRAGRAEEMLESVRERARASEERLAEARQRVGALAERAETLAASLEASRRERESLRGRARAAEERVATLRGRLGETSARVDQSNAALAALRVEERRQRERAREAEAQLAQSVARLTEAQNRLSDWKDRLASAEASSQSGRERALRAEEEGAALRERARSAEAAIAGAKARASEAERLLRERGTALEEVRNRVASLDEQVEGLNAELEAARIEIEDSSLENRVLRDREESALARLAQMRQQLEVESQRAGKLNATLMSVQHAQELMIERERAAQSQAIAMRNRSKRAEARIVATRERAMKGEAKAEYQRVRALAAEKRMGELEVELARAREEQAAERERANDALGRLDAARRVQDRLEAELEAMRAKLAGILGQ